MPSKHHKLALVSAQQRPTQVSLAISAYPELFIIPRADLIGLQPDRSTIGSLIQLADMLMLLEHQCARIGVPPTRPLAECSVFIIDLLMRLTHATHEDGLAS